MNIEKRAVFTVDCVKDDLYKNITGDYMNLLEKQARPHLEQHALQAAEKALQSWGGDRKHLSWVVFASDTHFKRNIPSFAVSLVLKLQLSASTKHLALSDMGCCGGYQALTLCSTLARSRPGTRILLVMFEAAGTQHAARQSTLDKNDLLQFALFGDGFAAAVVGSGPLTDQEADLHRLEFLRDRADVVPFTEEFITHAYLANCVYSVISEQLPERLAGVVPEFVKSLLSGTGVDLQEKKAAFLIHPGVPKIVRELSDHYELTPAQNGHSWKCLNEHGNMSGVSNLAVVDNFLRGEYVSKFSHSIALSFGPGIALQGILFRVCCRETRG